MIRITRVKPLNQSHGIIFRESALAHRYCVGSGLEVGAAAHNPFNLAGCINVADQHGVQFYRDNQVEMCGGYAEIDLEADAADIPLPDQSQDYVISSHMIEHHPDPISVFLEWQRLLKVGGIVFMIFPKRDALPADQKRPVTDVGKIVAAYDQKLTVETAPEPEGQGKGGHYYVYTLNTMKELVQRVEGLRWELVEELETDDKVGNGHLLVYRQLPVPIEEEPLVEEAPVAEEEKPVKPRRKPSKR